MTFGSKFRVVLREYHIPGGPPRELQLEMMRKNAMNQLADVMTSGEYNMKLEENRDSDRDGEILEIIITLQKKEERHDRKEQRKQDRNGES